MHVENDMLELIVFSPDLPDVNAGIHIPLAQVEFERIDCGSQ